MPEHLVTLEMKGCIEEIRFSADGAIHILLQDGRRSNCCGRRRWWFVNRDGETRCWDCDDKFQQEIAKRCRQVFALGAAI